MSFIDKWLRRLFGKQAGLVQNSASPAPEVFQFQPDLYPIFPPAPPRDLIDRHNDHLKALRKRSFAAPKGETEDRPSFVLYQLYEHILLDNIIGMCNKIEAFWWTKTPVSDIPDPQDEAEPERYAVLSCILALLVESFNQRIEMGLRREAHSLMSQEKREVWAATPKILETVPHWVAKVAPLKVMLHIPHRMDGDSELETLDDQRASPPFKEKNILIWNPHIHFM
jgi:hypothetical protein